MPDGSKRKRRNGARGKARFREGQTMEYANRLVIETAHKVIEIALRHPLTLEEVYYHFVKRNKRPALVSLSGGVARVTF